MTSDQWHAALGAEDEDDSGDEDYMTEKFTILELLKAVDSRYNLDLDDALCTWGVVSLSCSQ